jgi:hypothetical protein
MADERERVGEAVVTRSPLECHQTKKQRLFGGVAMTAGRHHKNRRIARTTSQPLIENCSNMRPQPGHVVKSR